MNPTRRGFLGTLIAGAILPKLIPAQSPSEPLKPVPIQDLSSSLSISYSYAAEWLCENCGKDLYEVGLTASVDDFIRCCECNNIVPPRVE